MTVYSYMQKENVPSSATARAEWMKLEKES